MVNDPVCLSCSKRIKGKSILDLLLFEDIDEHDKWHSLTCPHCGVPQEYNVRMTVQIHYKKGEKYGNQANDTEYSQGNN